MADTMTAEPKPTLRLTTDEAIEIIGSKNISYATLRKLAVDKGEFTVVRNAPGRGNPISLLRDEVIVYAEGALPALRKFRAKKGRK